MALSLSFDDARASNTALGIPLLDEYGVKATFFVLPAAVQRDLEAWKKQWLQVMKSGIIQYLTHAAEILSGQGIGHWRIIPWIGCSMN
jgi:peptidoglycan/xylan/chitin deacetylase (PgdA/CDA1 family)